MVCLFHWCNNDVPTIISHFIYLGSIGVDIFVFLSGFGLYFSFSKDSRVTTFYVKRGLRIVPPYWLGLLTLQVIALIRVGQMNVGLLLEEMFFVDFWINEVSVYWYLPFIVLLYLFFPIYYKAVDTINKKRLLLIGVIIICFGSHFIPGLEATKYTLAYDRLPVFILGSIVAQHIIEESSPRFELGKRQIPLLVFAFFACLFASLLYIDKYYLKPYNLKFYFYLPLSVLIILLSTLLFKLDRSMIFVKALNIIGTLSLELYISHVIILFLMDKYIIITNTVMNLISFLILSLVSAYLLKKVGNLISGKLSKIILHK